MARIIVTAPANADTSAILIDLAAKAGVGVASWYNSQFTKLYKRLATFPESGAPRLSLGRSVGIGVVAPYVVI